MNQYEKYKTASQSTSSTYKLIIIFDNIIKILNNTKKAAEKNDILGKIDGFNKVIDIFNVLRNSFNDEAQRYPLIKVLIKFNNLAVEKAAELNTKEYSVIETDKFINSVASIRNTLIEGEKKGKFL